LNEKFPGWLDLEGFDPDRTKQINETAVEGQRTGPSSPSLKDLLDLISTDFFRPKYMIALGKK